MNPKIVIVDDDHSALKAIKNYCGQLDLEVVDVFDSPSRFLEKLDKLVFDVAILDYAMPQYNGIQLAEVLNSKNIPVIFVTGHRDEIASKAWDLNCIACIEKPVNVDKIKQAVSKFKPHGNDNSILEIEIYGGKLFRIKVMEIAHIGKCDGDTSGNDRTLTDMLGKEYRVVNKKLEDFMSLLPQDKFMRVGRSDIVGKHAIAMYAKNYEEVTLSVNKKQVSISPHRKDDFKLWFHN